MILRLLRAHAPVDRAEEVAAALGGPLLAASRGLPGLSSYASGLRVDPEATRFVIASTWDSLTDIGRQTHGRLEQAVVALPEFAVSEDIEHLELVGAPFAIHVAPPSAVLRLARMTVRAGREEEFYSIVRGRIEGLQVIGDLLAYHLGRRVEEDRHVATAVSVWRSVDALGEWVEPATGEPLWGRELGPLLEEFEVEHFDAVLGPR